MMKIRRSLVYIAGLGLLASAAAHVATFLGVNPKRAMPGVMVLHLLTFIVGIPAAFMARKACAKDDPWSFWGIITRHAPLWMKVLPMVLLPYSFFNFFHTSFVLNQRGVPSTSLGLKALVSHGKVIRRLTDEEYERHQAYSVRGYSGHWMLFYAVAMTVLYSLAKEGAGRDVDSAAQAAFPT